MLKRLRDLFSARPRDVPTAPSRDFDFYAVGFPKTGNTWTRFMLGRYIQTVHGLESLPLFDPEEMRLLREKGYTGPTGIFTHEPLTWRTQTAQDLNHANVIEPFRKRRVLFLTRHPLDTNVSNFMHMKHKAQRKYEGDLSAFMTDSVFGLDKLFRYHALWAKHRSEVPAFMLWRYEDVKADPAGMLRKLLAFLDQPVDERALVEAVDFAAFDNLKALEASGKAFVYQSSGMRAFGARPTNDPNAFHVRKGEVGGYRNEFPAEECAVYEAKVRSHMPSYFGYSDPS